MHKRSRRRDDVIIIGVVVVTGLLHLLTTIDDVEAILEKVHHKLITIQYHEEEGLGTTATAAAAIGVGTIIESIIKRRVEKEDDGI